MKQGGTVKIGGAGIAGLTSAFKKHVDFDVYEEKKFTGFGNFFYLKSEKKYIGEAGGFQDFLWGFGMRYAMVSAHLACRSILEYLDYQKLWKAELWGHKRSSIASRLWFSMLNDYCFNRFIKLLHGRKDALSFVDNIYRYNMFSRILYPFARLYFNDSVKDKLTRE